MAYDNPWDPEEQRRQAQQMSGTQNNPQTQQAFPTFGDVQPGGTGPTAAPQQQTQGTAKPPAPAQQPPQTFAQMQQAGLARPPAPAPAPQPQMPAFQYGASPLSGQVQSALSQMFSRPTAYDDDVIQAQRTAGRNMIEEGYNADKARLDEEMARRGIWSSSVAGGRLSDLMTGKQRALQAEEAGFLANRAGAMDQGLRAALGFGLQYDQNAADNAMRSYALNLQRQGMDADNAWRYAQLAQQEGQFGREFGQRQYEFGQSYGLDRDRFGEASRQFDLGFGLDRDRFGESRRQFDTGLDFDRQRFGEDTRRFDLGRGDRRYEFDKDYGLADRGMTLNENRDWRDAIMDLFGLYGGTDLADTGYDPYEDPDFPGRDEGYTPYIGPEVYSRGG